MNDSRFQILIAKFSPRVIEKVANAGVNVHGLDLDRTANFLST